MLINRRGIKNIYHPNYLLYYYFRTEYLFKISQYFETTKTRASFYLSLNHKTKI